MKDKVNKFLEIEDRVFRAPYNYLKEKGIIDKVIELKARFVEIYEKDEHIPYGGNQMFPVTTKPSFLYSTDNTH